MNIYVILRNKDIMSKYMLIEFNDHFKRNISSQTINTKSPVLVVYESKNQLYRALIAYIWNYISLECFVGDVGDLRYNFNVDSVEKFFDTICKNKHYILSLKDFHNDFLHNVFSFDEFYEITLLNSIDLNKKSIQIKKFYLEY